MFQILNIYKTKFLCMIAAFFAVLMLPAFPTYADEATRAHLYFCTVDGEEIEDLTKDISTTKEYEFKDPDKYKYLSYEDEDGRSVYPELYYEVEGLYWEEQDSNGKSLGKYYQGDRATFNAGDHYFYVKTNSPELTGENLLNTPQSDHVYLYFYTSDWIQIDELSTTIYKTDKYTFANPSQYVYFDDEDESGQFFNSGDATYWGCMDDSGKSYIFANKDTCTFNPGEYEFHVILNEEVTVKFYYPEDVPTYFTDDHYAGELYATMTGMPGEYITLKKGLGSIIWGCDFKGWHEDNYEEDDSKIFPGGYSYRIMDNQNLAFYAIYEENDNWDMNAKDENKDGEEEEEETKVLVDITVVNDSAGVGFNAYIYDDGTLRRYGGGGIKGTIKTKGTSDVTSLRKGGDPTNAEDYLYDNNGRKFEDIDLEPDMGNVLKEDYSAMYMDVYGNAFIRYSGLSPEDNMEIALRRLQDGKTDSWVYNIENWDSEVVKRFEAIEFAFLYNKYPEEGQDLFENLNPDVTLGETMIWHDDYMSEKAYKSLKPYRQMWTGWYDVYEDGYYEMYKNGGVERVGQTAYNAYDSFGSPVMLAEAQDDRKKKLRVSFVQEVCDIPKIYGV